MRERRAEERAWRVSAVERDGGAPSTALKRELGGVYVSMQLGQKSLTVSTPGRSDRPHGTILVVLQ